MSKTLFDLAPFFERSFTELLPAPATWGLKNIELEPIVTAFCANNDRIHCLLLQTPTMVQSAYLHGQIHTAAFIDTFHQWNPSDEVKAANPALMRQFHERSQFLGEQHNSSQVRDEATIRKELTFGLSFFESLIDAHKDTSEICRGAEATISSAVIQACTAIDVLCTDLCLGVADPPLKQKLEGKFASLKTIRESFSKVFVGGDAVLEALANKSLDALSQARHLLVHRAGITDAKYVKYRADNGILEMPDLTIGDPFPLTGGVAGPLIAKGIECGKKLVHAVDEWLWNKTHPTVPSNRTSLLRRALGGGE